MAGGLVESRDFVDLRHWQLLKNGQFITDEAAANDQLSTVNEVPAKSKQNNDEPPMKKSSSVVNLMDTSPPAMDESVNSLSKSLGAGVFSEVDPQTSALQWSNNMNNSDDADEFVDATESHDVRNTTDTSHRSEEAEPIQDIVNDLCDKMYIVSGTSIKFDGMPVVSKYVR